MQSKKEKQIKDLWRAAFGDNENFIRMYFKHVYKAKYALTLEHEGQLVSSLMLLPYKLNYYGRELLMGYIAGACTLEGQRGKGWMTRLMHKTFEQMRRRGMYVATLIPASPSLFDFYERYGFSRAFEYSPCVYARQELGEADGSCRVLSQDTLGGKEFAYVDRKLRERAIGVLHDRRDMDNIGRDICLSGGRMYVARRADTICGIAFATPFIRPGSNPEERSALVREIVYEDGDAMRALLLAATENLGVERALCRMPYIAQGTAYSYGMARAIDPEAMFEIRKAACGAKMSLEELKAMDIKQQTAYLLDYADRKAYMSLMLD
ncbi:MAG: GNAT family N-acetyltransferase [Tannerellaceae bacterium]|jgi:GNAT superfamily N-acetyltransferase|nr:GNAT family N-acetyltransferase [Tannerellaceae bacterium]